MEKGSPARKYSTAGNHVGSSFIDGGLSVSGSVGAGTASTGWDASAPLVAAFDFFRPGFFGIAVFGCTFQDRRFRLGLALGGLFTALLEPLLVSHLAARGEPAHPGAMRSLGKVDRDAKFARGYGQAVDVVLVLVSDHDGVEGLRSFFSELHAPEKFAAA